MIGFVSYVNSVASNGDTEVGALMFVFDFDKVAYQL